MLSATLAAVAACGNGASSVSMAPNDGDAATSTSTASAGVEGRPPTASSDPKAPMVLPRSSETTPAVITTEPAAPVTVTVTVTPQERQSQRQQRATDSIPEGKGALKQIDVSAHETYWFRAPSKNITCLMAAGDGPESDATVRCTIVSKEWRSPAKPQTCPLDWGSDLEIDGNGRPGFACAGDTILGASTTVEYGTRLIMKPGLTCSVTTDGVTCANRFTTQGFSLARESYRIF